MTDADLVQRLRDEITAVTLELDTAERQRDEALALLREERMMHGAALTHQEHHTLALIRARRRGGNQGQCRCDWCLSVDALLTATPKREKTKVPVP